MSPWRLSRWLGRRRVVHSNWMLTSGVARGAVAFGANLVLVRFIAPEEFGDFALSVAKIGLVVTVISLRVGVQVIRAREDEVAGGRMGLYFNVLVRETALAGVVAAAWLFLSGALGFWTGVLLVGLLLQHFVNNSIAFYERRQPYVQIALLEGGGVFAGHGLSVALVLLGAGAPALYVRELALALATGAALAAVGGLHVARLRRLAPDEWRTALRQAGGVWLEGMLEGAFQRISMLLAGAVGSAAAVGFFYQARRLAVVPQQLLGPVTGRMTLNWFSRSDDEGARRRDGLRLLGLLALPLAAGSVLAVAFADPLIPLLFGDTWRPVVPLFVAMAAVLVFYTLFAVVKTYLLAVRRTRYLLVGRVLQFVGLVLPCAGVLVGREAGVWHVALGLSLAYVLIFAVCAGFAWRHSAR